VVHVVALSEKALHIGLQANVEAIAFEIDKKLTLQ